MPAYVERSLDEFVGGSDQEILAELHRSYAADGFVTQYTSQAVSWDASLGLLRTALSEVQREVPGAGAWRILLEYPLYRLRRRIDAIVLAERVAMVIEVKFGESRFEASDRRQVEEYALDLRDFHAPSRSIALVPILWCTAATAPTVYPPLSGPGVADVHLAGQNDLGDLIRRAVAASDALPLVAKEDWSAGAYRPVPSVIDAATTLFAGHGVEEIARADAKNLGAASEHIVALVADSRTRGSRALIFLTGVPGSGKTLAGLQVVHRAADPDLEAQGDIVYLSGNTPLVTVLREALARDEYNRRKTAGTHVRMADVRNAMRARIQHIIDFLRQYLTCPGEEPPHEHAIVFDEAQRAWDARHGAQKFGRTASEPALLLEIMSRHTDWSALVGLIGGGQEINTGENGIAEWGDALRALPEDERARWTVYGPSSVIDGDRSTAFLGLGELPQDLRVVHDDALRLEVPLRTFRTPKLAEWVEAVLRGNGVAARDLASQVEAYPLVLTRDLETARAWLKRMGRGERR
ncbi:MAG: DNA/RNA helicase domain-containing protein, partial [Phycisphaerales bacterium JB041]